MHVSFAPVHENSKRKHKEIIKDFFQSSHSHPIEKKIAEPEKEVKPEKKEVEIIQKIEKEPFKIEEIKKTVAPNLITIA